VIPHRLGFERSGFFSEGAVVFASLICYYFKCSTSSDAQGKLIESSYIREYQGNTVPMNYVFLTYEETDGMDYPWLFYPAPLPMYGNDLLSELGDSVTLACINDGAATPKYCMKEFFDSLAKIDNQLFSLLFANPFGPDQVKSMETALQAICSDCNNRLFNYMYLTWADASDEDKYLR
jgi:hypothetical protein